MNYFNVFDRKQKLPKYFLTENDIEVFKWDRKLSEPELGQESAIVELPGQPGPLRTFNEIKLSALDLTKLI